MAVKIVSIPLKQIVDRASFHEVFKSIFNFPDYYGRNLDAWIDCMSNLNPNDGEERFFSLDKGKIIILDLENISDFRQRCPSEYEALLMCVADVNARLINTGEAPYLALRIT